MRPDSITALELERFFQAWLTIGRRHWASESESTGKFDHVRWPQCQLVSTSYISIIYAYHNGHMFHWCRLGVQVRLVFIARAGTNTGRQPDWTYAWRDKSYAVPQSELLPRVNKKLKTILSGGWVQEQRWFSQHNPQVILLTKLVLVEEDEASAWRLHHDVWIWAAASRFRKQRNISV